MKPRNGLQTRLSGNFLAMMPHLFSYIKMISDYQGGEHSLRTVQAGEERPQ